ncbi:expressed unknown protein [Seminavis robusta]|uniref:Uncharacterized protein n=1 Tax=Seminavis robusta TaxID=568900 RepID=A0A9N8HNX4_9STRA|nr:expressed unknown protein [Seminavis robusta]|eukprot:Sro1021_g232230.1 n/a (431) ;mRNA; f:12055-13569
MSDTSNTEALGWMAAFASMLAFGSFGVPIKSDAANSVDIDPLVFQSYKSLVCFATSWLVLLAGVPFSFTPWGIVSCIFWVPGGVATVFAIRNAGLAIAIGIGSSSIVLVSFVWGIFIFDEDIHSRVGASMAIVMMMAGILGMSYFSAPPPPSVYSIPEQQLVHVSTNNTSSHSTNDFVTMVSQDEQDRSEQPQEESNHDATDTAMAPYSDDPQSETTTNTESTNPHTQGDDEEFEQEYNDSTITTIARHGAHDPLERLHIYGTISMTRRQLGIMGAVFNGVWGGSIMAPMKWCHDDKTSGAGYLISFGIGAAVVTTFLWILRLVATYHRHASITEAYRALPSFHWKIMWCAGGTSGLLWSTGNFFSILSVYYLGEGVGYSVVQAGMLVSGLWGILYFHEIKGAATIAKWLASASITICGIILLSYEHHKT